MTEPTQDPKTMKLCPVMSDGSEELQCVREKCAWWVEQPNMNDQEPTGHGRCAKNPFGKYW